MSLILITGATDGIGLQTAIQLASQGHELVLHGRSEETVKRACEIVRRTTPNAVLHVANADLADFAAVAGMAQHLAQRLPRLDVLLNNAGVYMTQRRLTPNDFEMTLAINHLAHFLLAALLLPLLKKSNEPRVITVSSIAHNGGRIEFDNLNGERHFDGYSAYANSKLANVLFANELARREPWLCSNSLHPGVISTKLLHAGFDIAGAPVEQGAHTSVFLACSSAVQGITGKYFDHGVATSPSQLANDPSLAQQLWSWSTHALRPWLPQGI